MRTLAVVVQGLLALRSVWAFSLRMFAGHAQHSFFQPGSASGSGCEGAAFFESVESYGGCIVKRDEAGKAAGSYALFLCSAQEYFNAMSASGSDDSSPTARPVHSTVIKSFSTRRPTRRPSPRPSSRPSPRPSPRATPAVVRGLSEDQLLDVNDQTLLVVDFTYPTLDCSGTEASTIATGYDQDPEKFLYPGLCRPSSRTTGTFSSGVRFSGRFVASQSFVFIDGESSSYNVSSFAASAGRVAPPPLSIQGLVTEYFPDSQGAFLSRGSVCGRGSRRTCRRARVRHRVVEERRRRSGVC